MQPILPRPTQSQCVDDLTMRVIGLKTMLFCSGSLLDLWVSKRLGIIQLPEWSFTMARRTTECGAYESPCGFSISYSAEQLTYYRSYQSSQVNSRLMTAHLCENSPDNERKSMTGLGLAPISSLSLSRLLSRLSFLITPHVKPTVTLGLWPRTGLLILCRCLALLFSQWKHLRRPER